MTDHYHDGSERCEDCGGPIDEPRLTHDGHPKGPNLVVCAGCEERHLDSGSDRREGDDD